MEKLTDEDILRIEIALMEYSSNCKSMKFKEIYFELFKKVVTIDMLGGF